jgi:hypothetical protein
MNNKPKDRYENKLRRYLKEERKLCEKLKKTDGFINLEKWSQAKDELQRRLGLNQDDCQRAYALARHSSDRHFWCDSQFHKGEQKQNAIAKAERKLKPADEVLEQELKDEDDFIMDVYDEYYDPEKDMCR